MFCKSGSILDLDPGAAAVAVVMLTVNLSLAWAAGRLIMRGATGEPALAETGR